MSLNINVNKKYNYTKKDNKDPDKYCNELGETHCILWSSEEILGNLN